MVKMQFITIFLCIAVGKVMLNGRGKGGQLPRSGKFYCVRRGGKVLVTNIGLQKYIYNTDK